MLFTRLKEALLIPILAPTRNTEKGIAPGSLIPAAAHGFGHVLVQTVISFPLLRQPA